MPLAKHEHIDYDLTIQYVSSGGTHTLVGKSVQAPVLKPVVIYPIINTYMQLQVQGRAGRYTLCQTLFPKKERKGLSAINQCFNFFDVDFKGKTWVFFIKTWGLLQKT